MRLAAAGERDRSVVRSQLDGDDPQVLVEVLRRRHIPLRASFNHVPQFRFETFASRVPHLHIAYLFSVDEPPCEGLANRLADYVFGDGIGFNQVKNCANRLRIPKPLCNLYVPHGHIRMVQNEDFGKIAIPPKMLGNRHVQLRRIHIRKLPEVQCSLMAVDSFRFFAAVSGPESPLR